jgi:hypothetical protein
VAPQFSTTIKACRKLAAPSDGCKAMYRAKQAPPCLVCMHTGRSGRSNRSLPCWTVLICSTGGFIQLSLFFPFFARPDISLKRAPHTSYGEQIWQSEQRGGQ